MHMAVLSQIVLWQAQICLKAEHNLSTTFAMKINFQQLITSNVIFHLTRSWLEKLHFNENLKRPIGSYDRWLIN